MIPASFDRVGEAQECDEPVETLRPLVGIGMDEIVVPHGA